MSRPTPRRPASSRASTARPRRIAGQGPTPEETPAASTESAAEEPDAVPAKATAGKKSPSRRTQGPVVLDKTPGADRSETSGRKWPTVTNGGVVDDGADDDAERTGVLARATTTRILIAVLALVTVACSGLVLVGLLDDDEKSDVVAKGSAVAVPVDRPVLIDSLTWLDGVDKAAQAAQEIVAVAFQKYDDEVEKAADLMTDDFAEQYRTTAADIKDEFVANQTEVQATVVAQGVVRANRTQLQALVFLNQIVTRVRAGEPETVLTPYKVLVTMVHTDKGWLVSNLETDAPQDKTN